MPSRDAREIGPQPDRGGEHLAFVTVVGRPVPVSPAARRAGMRVPDESSRDCGPCRECCRLPDIPELDKPIDTWCRHVDRDHPEGGCMIYDRRPGVCREFDCAWKQGLGGPLDRPDILGVMWQTVTMPDGEPGLGVVEAREGALGTPRVRRQLREFEARKPGRIIVRRAHETRFSSVMVLIEGKPLRPAMKPG